MDKVEETVLIPKDEYESLLEKVSVQKQTHQHQEQQQQQVVDMSATVDTSSGENSQLDVSGVRTEELNKSDKTVDESTEPSEGGDEWGRQNVTANPSQASDPDKGASYLNNVEGSEAGEILADNSANISDKTDIPHNESGIKKKGGNKVNSVNLLLDKVSVALKHPVRMLADYLVENGEGIIEWNSDLRFVYFGGVVPKTNFAKLMSYAFKK